MGFEEVLTGPAAAPSWAPPTVRVVPGVGVEYCSPSTTTVYLTGVSTHETRDLARRLAGLGLLVTPASALARQLDRYQLWAADNGCFAGGDRFDADDWLRWLDGLPRRGCLFAVCPDVVADAVATLERSSPYLAEVRAMGFPAGLVAQDGLEDLEVPWDDFDCLFVGGSTDWKLSGAAAELAAAARAEGKWVHVGRVNSWKRIRLCAGAVGADSVDGTFLAFGPKVNLPKLLSWLNRLPGERFELGQEHRFVRRSPAELTTDQPGAPGVTWAQVDVSAVADEAAVVEELLVEGRNDEVAVQAMRELLFGARTAFADGEAVTTRRSSWTGSPAGTAVRSDPLAG